MTCQILAVFSLIDFPAKKPKRSNGWENEIVSCKNNTRAKARPGLSELRKWTIMDPVMAAGLPEPDLDTSTTSPAVATAERERIRSGNLHGMAWLIIFSPIRHESESSPWSIIQTSELTYLPAGIAHYAKMDAFARTETRTLQYRDGKSWPSCIFARGEKGKTCK